MIRWAAWAGRLWGRLRGSGQCSPDALGRLGERVAARFLGRRGYRIVARRARDRLGELDLVAVDGRTIVFVEVKTRQTSLAGHPVLAVDHAKQRRLTRVASGYLKRHDLVGYSARFDVIAIVWPPDRPPQISHYRNAFEAQGD